MGFETILTEARGRGFWITLNRPDKRNTLSPQVLHELCKALERADQDASVGAVVITGAGDKAFCAGGDLTGVAGDGPYLRHEASRAFLDLFWALERMGKPVVAAVNGVCLGGGLGMAVGCDVIVAVEDAKLGTPEIKLGLFPHIIMASLFRNTANPKKMWEMVLTGEKVSGEDAVALGFVNHLVKREDLIPYVEALVEKLGNWSPAATRLGRRAFYTMRDMTFPQALEYLQTVLTVNSMTEDALEGIGAFFGKREPEWKGR